MPHLGYYLRGVVKLYQDQPTQKYMADKNHPKNYINIKPNQQIISTSMAELVIALNSSLKLDKVLDQILLNLEKIVPNNTSNIMLLTGDQTKIVRSRGYDKLGVEEILNGKVFDINRLVNFKKMRETKESIATVDTHKDPDWVVLPESKWIGSHLSAPIIIKGEVIGFINCDSDIPGFYNETYKGSIKLFADLAGLAINNARRYNASRNLVNRLQKINDLTHQLLEAKSLDEIVLQLPEKIKELFQAENVYISRWNDDLKIATGWAASGENQRSYPAFQTSPGDKTLSETILNSRRAMLVKENSISSIMDPKFLHLYSERTILGLPLVTQDEKIGVVLIGFQNPEQVTDEDIAFGEYFAIQLSSALAKIRSLEREKTASTNLSHAIAQLETLSLIAAAVKSGTAAKNVMISVGKELEKLDIHILVAMMTENSESLFLSYTSIESKLINFLEKVVGVKANDLHTPVNLLPIIRDAAINQDTQFIEDPNTALKYLVPAFMTPFLWKLLETLSISKVTKCIVAPMVVEQKTIGLLSLWSDELQIFDLKAASIFASQIAIAIQNANLIEEIKHLAVTDDLTGILNRRGFADLANREYGIAKRLKRPLSLILVDIDQFKQINDTFGHLVGDAIIKQVAERCKHTIRDIDIISRYGGDELLILLVESSLKNSCAVAERLRKVINQKPFIAGQENIKITISLGVVENNSDYHSLSDIIKKADVALYNAKENGRNCVSTLAGVIDE
jgi:diguanylate cyclase (GGDEF)-like protein